MALDDLLRYESAAVAAVNVKNEKDIALLAVQDLYKTMYGKEVLEDPIYAQAFSEAEVGINSDAGITNAGIVKAIQAYNDKYELAFQNTSMKDITKYLTTGYKVSDEVREALELYGELTITDIAKKLKDKELTKEGKEELQKTMSAVGLLKDRKLRAKTLDIYNSVVKQNLDSLYPKLKENEESKK